MLGLGDVRGDGRDRDKDRQSDTDRDAARRNSDRMHATEQHLVASCLHGLPWH